MPMSAMASRNRSDSVKKIRIKVNQNSEANDAHTSLGHFSANSLWEAHPSHVIGGDMHVQQLISVVILESGKELFKVID